jgi:hypothetical protein
LHTAAEVRLFFVRDSDRQVQGQWPMSSLAGRSAAREGLRGPLTRTALLLPNRPVSADEKRCARARTSGEPKAEVCPLCVEKPSAVRADQWIILGRRYGLED